MACEKLPEAQPLADDGAAVARDDVRADLGETALRLVREAGVQLLRDRQPEHAVPEELQTLVRVRAARSPGGMRESVMKTLGRKRLDQSEELAPRLVAIGGNEM